MRLSFVFLQLLSIINTLRGVSGEQETTSDNLHIKFERHIEFDDDWEDDFYQHFNKGKSDREEDKKQDQLWIDWSEVDEEEFAEALDVNVDENSAEAESEDDQVSEDDSFITARDRLEFEDSVSDDEGLLNFDDEYSFIEGISDSDSESVTDDDEFYNQAMGDIAECFDTESSTDEDISPPVTKD